MIKQFIRNFRKQKVIGFLNIAGLSLGVMVSLIIGLWAINEFKFDDFHEKGDRMYRVVEMFDFNNKPIKAASAFKPLGEIAELNIPEIEEMNRVVKEISGVTINNIVTFNITSLITDNNFFSFFSFPLKEGNINNILSAPDNVVITESASKKYFPGENPIGKQITFHGYDFVVNGIMYDFPLNSHIQADMVFPLFGFFKTWGWDSGFYYDTYFILSQDADIPSIEKEVTDIAKLGLQSFLQDSELRITLEPLKEIHFSKTDAGFDSAIKGDKNFLFILIFTALVILIIACINFANLFVSTSFIRAKSIGIKKTHGASRTKLILEFYLETTTYVLISVTFGILLTILIFPVFNSYMVSGISIDFTNKLFYFFIISLSVFTILLAGSLPAIQLTRFGIIETLQGKFKGKRMSFLQRVLVVMQFTSSIFLLIVVIFFNRQINTLLNQDLGFNNEKIVYVNGWGRFGYDFKAFREEMIKEPSISDVAMKQYDLPLYTGNGIGGRNIKTMEPIMLDLSQVSPNYFDFFEMEFVIGENPLILESSNESMFCVLNERAVEVLGIEDPVGALFSLVSIGGVLSENDGKFYTVKGVIRDSYVKSLHKEPDPQMYINLMRESYNPIFFKIAGDSENAINAIEKKWKEMNPNVSFEYHFLDEIYDAQYQPEMKSEKILSYALIITFIITIMGLFAMSFYSIQKRIKEIAIRKINGATVKDLLLLLAKDTLIWILISFLIACCISYIFLKNWLNNFIIKTPLSIWIFLLAGIISCVVALLTISYQTIKTAISNPVDSLKNE